MRIHYHSRLHFDVTSGLDKVDIQRYEDLYNTNPRRARIVCDGEWGVAEGLIYENVKVKNFDKDELLKDEAYQLAIWS